jgi:lipopolysaccharide transport system ATP-binding protein
MNNYLIKTENISKRYPIRKQNARPDTLVGTVIDFLYKPVRNLKELRNLSSAQNSDYELESYIWALNKINLKIKNNEKIGIIGKNGSGKSTLLKILSRITKPTNGTAIIKGRVASLIEVGTGFHQELSGRENVYLNGSILGMSKSEIDQKYDEIIAFSGVAKFIDTPIKRYSSGMRVRLAFSVAAHLEPEILIIDEVLAVGDASFQKKCLGKMDDVAKSGRTVLFVSHNLESIISLCDRVIWIDDGEIKGDGNPLQIVNQYLETINNISESQIDLTSINRDTNSSFQFSKLIMMNQNNIKSSSFNVGDDLIIKLKYSLKDQNLLKSNLQVKISIHNSTQTEVLNLNNEVSGYIHKLINKEGHVVCKIPHIPLGEGIYSINIEAIINSGAADVINNVGSFEIIPGDYFGTGVPNNTKANFYCISEWE